MAGVAGPQAATETQQGAGLLNYNVVAQPAKNPPAVQETPARPLSWEDPLEKQMATYSNILVGRIPWAAKSTGSQTVGHD